MKDLLERLLDLLPGDLGEKGMKFLGVTAFNVVFGQSLLLFAQVVLDLEPLPANVLAVSVSAVPAYLLSRYWVWQKTTKNQFWREILPFWALTFLGLVISTLAVWGVHKLWPDLPAIAVNLTNLGAFGVLWVAKFVILDKVLFVPLAEEHEDHEDHEEHEVR